MSAVLNQPVVIDNGTGIIKAGFAGADKPKVRQVLCSRLQKTVDRSFTQGEGAASSVDHEGGEWLI